MREGHAGVRLMNDNACRWPLWWAEGLQAEPGILRLSEDLETRVRALAQHFDDHFEPVSHWDDDDAKSRHARLAGEVEAGLVAEIGHDLEVRSDLWELTD
jgi:hypothetical protein